MENGVSLGQDENRQHKQDHEQEHEHEHEHEHAPVIENQVSAEGRIKTQILQVMQTDETWKS